MSIIQFVVPGPPVPKARPRVTQYGTYTPKRTLDYEKAVYTAWKQQSGVVFQADTPLIVYVYAHFAIPKSLSEKKKQALVGQPYTKQRGDMDNIVKAVLDALNKHAFADDSAVCAIVALKDYQPTPTTTVIIKEYKEDLICPSTK